jgi:23S rRNA pseudouridine1911/1915/1917 synthase
MDARRLLDPDEELALYVRACDAGLRIDRWIARQLPWTTRSRVTRWIREGRARIEGVTSTRAGRPVRDGERITLRPLKTPRDADADLSDLLALPIVHRASDFLVVDKPPGIPSHPAGGTLKRTLLTALAIALEGEYEAGGPWLPHRLDRETAGLSLVALTREAMVRLSAALAARQITRLYSARVHGKLTAHDTWTDLRFPLSAVGRMPKRVAVAPQGVAAHTRLRVLARDGSETLVRLEAVTGRQHQLRVHLAHLGYPIVGDPLYGPGPGPGSMQLLADELVVSPAACGAEHACRACTQRSLPAPPQWLA